MPATLNLPQPNEIEVSLFGPGYGESVVVHLGGDEWLVVDSCQNFATKRPAPLEYLNRIRVQPHKAVKLIVATHWHDDHIRGLGTLLRVCEGANFACSAALGKNEFLTLVASMAERSLMASTGVSEFAEILKILQDRKANGVVTVSPQLALDNRLLWKRIAQPQLKIPQVEVWSLSPSDASVTAALTGIRALLPTIGSPKKRVPAIQPNHASVVLWISVGDSRVLLGADLENTADAARGWTAILASALRPDGKASMFKVPHHGSDTADDPQVWSTMLDLNPLAVLTPFIKGDLKLPMKSDVNRIYGCTSTAYSTATLRYPPIRRSKMVQRTIRETVKRIQPVYGSSGHIRLRTDLSNAVKSPWIVDLFQGACRSNEVHS